jgi:tetratricopeptide (TPR) repeat protein
VAQELGVSAILEGAVQKAGDKVRVNVQLIDARTDTHLWAKSYDRELKDVFAVESEISQEIADALRARLSPQQSHILASAPTGNSEAYDSFLRGEYEEHRGEVGFASDAFDRADSLYREAIARDPSFALAYARLAYSLLYRHWFVNPLTASQLADVRKLIDRSLSLQPDLPDAQIDLGVFHYWGFRDYEPALVAFRRALELQPNNAVAHANIAYIYRRQGKWEQCLAENARAAELDPRDTLILGNHGNSYLELRRWDEAEQWLRRTQTIEPSSTFVAYLLVNNCENSRADLECARHAFDAFPAANPVLALINTNEAASFAGGRAYLAVLQRKFPEALRIWAQPMDNSPTARMHQLQARVVIYVISRQIAAAKGDAEELRRILEERLKQFPEEVASMAGLAWAYAGLGRNADALQMAERAANTLPTEKDALTGARLLAGKAQIAALTGHPDVAVKLLRQLLSIPAGLVASTTRLKIDPLWDPIRNDPDFQQLLTMQEHVGP